MKKISKLSFAALAALSLFMACSKAEIAPSESTITPSGQPGDPGDKPVAPKVVTFTASLEDLESKVTFTPSLENNKPTGMALLWEAGDKLRVYNHANTDEYSDFALVAGAGTQEAIFSGTLPAGSSYDVEIVDASGSGPVNHVVIASNGSTADLKYLASATGIAIVDDETISLTDFSSVLSITAKMPSQEVAAAIQTVNLTASEDIFFSGNSVTIAIETPGSEDQYLHLYATLPKGTTTVPAGTTLMAKFNAPETAHTVYTRYMEMSATTFDPQTVNNININAEQSHLHAGVCKGEGACDGTTAAKAYLIADGYQLAAVYDLATPGATTYFKMMDDVDMYGISYTPINTSVEGFSQVVDFNGNNKTISKLSKCMFYVFKGAVYDLTLDLCSVTDRGIFAEYCQGSGHAVTNVTVSNSRVNYTGSNSGGLIGTINNGSGTTATLTNCTVSNTNIKCEGIVGGVVGFADALVIMTGCHFTGGTVENTANRYIGGMLGSTGNYNSVISNCSVTDATISAKVTNNDFRTGGFIGQQQTKVTVKGCTVGTSDKRVNITLAAPTSGKVYNAGGFVGVSYGTITKNGDVRSKAFVTITAANTEDKQMNLGGFAGYHTGTIEFSDADVSASSLYGSHIGGFAGCILQSGKIENATVTGTISGTEKTGGFVGVAEAGSITNCSATAIVSRNGSGNYFGGFVGEISKSFTMTKCSALADITVNSSYVGGFAGTISTASGATTTLSKCWSTGKVTSSTAQCGGFIGNIAANAAGNVNVSDCYETGNLIETNQRQGGFIGQINSGNVTLSRCYSAGTVSGSFAVGGLVGFMNAAATIQNCAAWNSSVTPKSYGNANWSTGAIIGVAWPIGTYTNNYRKPAMSLTAWWVPDADYNHPDVSSTTPLVVKDKTNGTLRATTATAAASGQDNYPLFAYHGKVEAGKTLSQLASTTLGWDGDIWDFTGDLPTLK